MPGASRQLEFAGSLTAANAGCIAFYTKGATAPSITTPEKASILVDTNAMVGVAAGSTWTATGGTVIKGGLNVLGAGTIDSAVTIADGATLTYGSTLATLTVKGTISPTAEGDTVYLSLPSDLTLTETEYQLISTTSTPTAAFSLTNDEYPKYHLKVSSTGVSLVKSGFTINVR